MINLICHAIDLRHPQALLLECLDQVLLVLLVQLHDGVSVLDGDTHLEEVLRECLLADQVFTGLCEDELYEGEEAARVI